MLSKLKGNYLSSCLSSPFSQLYNWLDRLLKRDPESRFQCASDAAFSLRNMITTLRARSMNPSTLEAQTKLWTRTQSYRQEQLVTSNTRSIDSVLEQTLNVLPAYEGMTDSISDIPLPPFRLIGANIPSEQNIALQQTGLELYAISNHQSRTSFSAR